MPEVISLLTSSPRRSPIYIPPPSCIRRRSPRFTAQSPSLSDFTFDIDDLPSANPSKRRRLTPSPISKRQAVQVPHQAERVFDLSSDWDIRFSSPQPKLPTVVNSTCAEDATFDIDDLEHSSPKVPISRTIKAVAPAPAMAEVLILSDSSCEQPDDIVSSSLPNRSARTVFSSTTANILAELESKSRTNKVVTKPAFKAKQPTISSHAKVTKSLRVAKPFAEQSAVIDNIIDSSQAAPAKSTKTVDKDALKEQKRLEKEQKALHKQRATELAEANKAKTNKKTAAPEMSLEMSSGLMGKAVGNQVEELLRQAEVKTSYFDEQIDMKGDVPMKLGNIVRWRRRVEADYVAEADEWRPLDKVQMRQEKHVLVYLAAEEICTIAVAGATGNSEASPVTPSDDMMKSNVDDYISMLRQQFGDTTLIILIQGLTAFLKKNQNAKNRDFATAVRSQTLPGQPAPSSQPNKTKKQPKKPTIDLSFLTDDHLENIQLHLQIAHQPLYIHHTTSPTTTALQILHFTTHLATRPYRLAQQSHNLKHASFCMSGNQIKTGRGDRTDTWIQMLQEITRVTPSMAHGIVGADFGGPAELVRGFRKVEREQGKDSAKEMLMDVRKAMNMDGGWSDKRLGPMVSKRLWKVFMGTDEGSRDGIA